MVAPCRLAPGALGQLDIGSRHLPMLPFGSSEAAGVPTIDRRIQTPRACCPDRGSGSLSGLPPSFDKHEDRRKHEQGKRG